MLDEGSVGLSVVHDESRLSRNDDAVDVKESLAMHQPVLHLIVVVFTVWAGVTTKMVKKNNEIVI